MNPLTCRILVAVAALVAFAHAPIAAQRATTASGVVEGVSAASGIRIFRGIPFAAPPVRELRWKAPQPVASWQGVRAADRFGPQCMQARIYNDMMFRNDGTGEDCLYLNVWTPATAPAAGLPVLVYFFGGGFMAGDGSEPRYDGESMARKGMVVVTLSYRLGVFGFFAHPELTAESPNRASGNYGLMDQMTALQWVQRNIAAFGGDPRRVTIAGESAGSYSVSAQMASPLARNLIAGAIGESGALLSGQAVSVEPRAATEQSGVRFGEMAGAPTLAALRALSAHELLEISGRPGVPRFRPNVDGWFFPKSPDEIFAAGEQARVPLLAGWNSEERSGRAILPDPATPEAFGALLGRLFGARSAEAARAFPASTPREAAQAATDLAGDQFIGFGTWKWLEEHAKTGQPVYRYFYSRARPPMRTPPASQSSPANPPLIPPGASHSAEIEYAMGNLALNPVYAWTPDDHRVSATMQEYFANFVKTGNPNGAGLPAWPTGRPGADGRAMRMRIDVESRAEAEPRDRYLFLDSYWSSQR